MGKLLNNIAFIFPVMTYYALEALIVSIFISGIWKLLLSQHLFEIGYLQIVGIYWIIKMLFFDVFKLISGLSSVSNNMGRELDEHKQHEE